MGVVEGKSAVMPLNSLNPNKAQLDLKNEVHYNHPSKLEE